MINAVRYTDLYIGVSILHIWVNDGHKTEHGGGGSVQGCTKTTQVG